jgi:hypothetical protein
MGKFSVKERFESQINEIWDDERFNEIHIKNRGYALQDEILQGALMFIGINPSHSGDKNERVYYTNGQDSILHPYFKKFQDISSKVKIPWTHMDLLFVKETQQKEVEKIFSCRNGLEFIVRQLNISNQVIELAKPKIIVVNNSLARKFLGFEKNKKENYDIWLDFDFIFDDKIGTYRIENHEPLGGIPIFFTSMLTGQRALDRGSYERLIWHINYVNERLS